MTTPPKPLPRVSPAKYKGMGDVVHTIAHPIARAIDHLAGTNLQGCAACGKRRDALNKSIPFALAIISLLQ